MEILLLIVKSYNSLRISLLPFHTTWAYVGLELLVSKRGVPPPEAMTRVPLTWTITQPFWTFPGFESIGEENVGGCHSNGCGNNDQDEIGILLYNERVVDYARNAVNSLRQLLLFPYQIVKVNEKLHQGKKRGRNTEYSNSKNPNKPRFWLGTKDI